MSSLKIFNFSRKNEPEKQNNVLLLIWKVEQGIAPKGRSLLHASKQAERRKMFYEDYETSLECSPGIKTCALKTPSCEASFVLLLLLYEKGEYGEGTENSAIYSLDGRSVTIRPTEAGKLYMSFTDE